MEKKITVKMDAQVLPYTMRLDTLISGVCPAFFPVSVRQVGKRLLLTCDPSGYRQLKHWARLDGQQILQMAYAVVQAIEAGKEYLFFPEEYVISVDTVYLREDLSQGRLIFAPVTTPQSATTNLLHFFHTLQERTTDNGRMYLDTLCTLLGAETLRYRRVLAFIHELLTEARLCEIH